jgi:hypothetical protein
LYNPGPTRGTQVCGNIGRFFSKKASTAVDGQENCRHNPRTGQTRNLQTPSGTGQTGHLLAHPETD